MKLIHTADIHLGSQLNLKANSEKINQRRAEIRTSFKNIVEFAKSQGVNVILLSGDIFDGERALKKDKEFFYSIVKNNTDIDFLYLRGNHDIKEGYNESLKNLKLFNDEWTYYSYGNVVISGVEITAKNYASLYSTLNLDKNKVNITMLHGQKADSVGLGLINLTKLKDKNIDYLALGHVHSYEEGELDFRGKFAYSGCPEGRGYDETGKKGIVLLEINENKVKTSFIPTSLRVISKVVVDCNGLRDSYEVYSRVKKVANLTKDNIYRVELQGEVDFDTEDLTYELEKYLENDCYLISIKDKLTRRFDYESLEGDVSLKSEFKREVLRSEELTEEEKLNVISIGLKALSGKEI